jgi:predicted metal-dependent peptidase
MTSVLPGTKAEPPKYGWKPTECPLDGKNTKGVKHTKLWEDTRVNLFWNCPGFAYIFVNLLNKVGAEHIAVFTRDVPIAATDGKALFFNPDTFFEYDLGKRLFIVVHEIMHCILNHCIVMWKFKANGYVAYPDGTKLPYVDELMNIAADLVINDILITSKVGTFDPGWLHDTKIATANDAVLDAYRKLFKQLKMRKGKPQPGDIPIDIPGISGKSFDEHMQPGTSEGKDANTAAQERNDTEWATGVAAAHKVHETSSRGRDPSGLERVIEEVLNPQVDWRDKVQSWVARKLGAGGYNWKQPDRRLIVRDIYAPGRSGYGCGTIVVARDSSGSIGDKEAEMFNGEIAGIMEDLRPERLIVLDCDAAVHRDIELDDPSDLATMAIQLRKLLGGGGTSFVPVFKWIDEQGLEPDALIYMTDGQGTFPKHVPRYPVMWGNISQPGSIKYPFGDVVDIPKQATD